MIALSIVPETQIVNPHFPTVSSMALQLDTEHASLQCDWIGIYIVQIKISGRYRHTGVNGLTGIGQPDDDGLGRIAVESGHPEPGGLRMLQNQ